MGYRKLLLIVWPAFLSACLLELLVFAFIDPAELHWAGHALGWSRQAAYTAAFFTFWVASMVASGLTALLAAPPPQEPPPR